MKECKKCNEPKHIREFSKHPATFDRLFPVCKICDNKRYRQYYIKNIIEQRIKKKKWQEKNRELHNQHAMNYYYRKKNRTEVKNVLEKEKMEW